MLSLACLLSACLKGKRIILRAAPRNRPSSPEAETCPGGEFKPARGHSQSRTRHRAGARRPSRGLGEVAAAVVAVGIL